MNKALLRILDANYNRAKEAMRVAEDILRFTADDANLTRQWKQARHQLTAVCMKLPVSYKKLLAARDSKMDVGRESLIQDTGNKINYCDLLIANAKRCQEALRVLEECSKLLNVRFSRHFQTLRFKIYDLEKKSLPKL